MTHPLSGRKQSPEHIRKRVESVARTKAAWSEAQRIAFAQKVREANSLRPQEMRDRFAHSKHPAWNKGKTCPQWSGANHWNYGNQMPQESIEKMRRSLTGKKQSPEVIAKRFASRNGYKHSEETKAKISRANSGKGNGNWLGGLTPYPTTYFKARNAIRDRDGHVCRYCGIGEHGHRHDVHHIDYDKKNIAPNNLVTLCRTCHGRTNYFRRQWQDFFNGAPQFQ